MFSRLWLVPPPRPVGFLALSAAMIGTALVAFVEVMFPCERDIDPASVLSYGVTIGFPSEENIADDGGRVMRPLIVFFLRHRRLSFGDRREVSGR
jgi:hypothetical protein